jgi:hypothetical protein
MRQFIARLLAGPMLVETPTRDDLARVWAVLEQYADAQLDFVDASIVALAEAGYHSCLDGRPASLSAHSPQTLHGVRDIAVKRCGTRKRETPRNARNGAATFCSLRVLVRDSRSKPHCFGVADALVNGLK